MISWEDSVKKRIYTGRKITSYGCSHRDLKQFSNSHDIVVQACHLWNSQFYVFVVTLHTTSLNWYQIMCFWSVQMLHSFWSLDKVCIICTINQSLEWFVQNHFQIPVILNCRPYFEIQMKKTLLFCLTYTAHSREGKKGKNDIFFFWEWQGLQFQSM